MQDEMTSIAISKKNKKELQNIGEMGCSFDDVITKLVIYYKLGSKK